ncbi:MAG: hypothetical protein N2746_05660 [Deltaproteobacteria bacterium]|nr:hypothetical protein [Deltaproteobacteria bacterium]
MRHNKEEIILEYLMSMNDYVRGEELGKIAHCSPQNISYHVRRLKMKGLDITVSHKGYKYDRDVDVRLKAIKNKFKQIDILFMHIRSCLDLKNIQSPDNDKKFILYTYNEANFFCSNSTGNFSFITNLFDRIEIPKYISLFLTQFTDNYDVRVEEINNDGAMFFTVERYIIGKYMKWEGIEHIQLVLNCCSEDAKYGYKIFPLSKLLGTYVGLKRFSILIFDFLYDNLTNH